MPSSRSARAPNARRFGGRAVASRLAVLSARCGPRVDGCAVATPQHSAACGSADCCSSSLVAWRRMSPCAATGARSGLAEHCCRLTVRYTSPGVQRGTKLNGTAVLRRHPSIHPSRRTVRYTSPLASPPPSPSPSHVRVREHSDHRRAPDFALRCWALVSIPPVRISPLRLIWHLGLRTNSRIGRRKRSTRARAAGSSGRPCGRARSRWVVRSLRAVIACCHSLVRLEKCVPCRAVPCRAVPCRAVPCRAVPCRAVRACVP